MAREEPLARALSTGSVLVSTPITHPEGFPEDYVFLDAKNEEHTVAELVDFEKFAISGLADGDFLSGRDDGQQYQIQLDDEGKLFLRVLLPDPAQLESPASLPLTLDQYVAFLKVRGSLLEQLLAHIRIANQLHKEAVQDAVDIVQSKRLDFIETKDQEFDVFGMFAVALTFVFIEFGVAEAIIQSAAKVALKVASGPMMKRSLDFLFKIAGRASGRSRSASGIRDLERSTAQLQLEAAQLSNRAVELTVQSNRSPSFEKAKRLNAQAFALRQKSQNKLSLVKGDERQKVRLAGELKDELIAIGKEDLGKILKFGRERVKPAAIAAADVLKEAGEAQRDVKDAPFADSKGSGEANPVPLDIHLKTFFQNFYESQVQLFERMLSISKLLLLEIETGGIALLESADLHQRALAHFPSLEQLRDMIAQYNETFGEEFSYTAAKEVQTREYEFLIWSLKLGSKVSFVKFEKPRKPDFDFTKTPVSPETPGAIAQFRFEGKIKDYLTNRFSLNEGTLAREMSRVCNGFNEKVNEINARLSDVEERRFRIGTHVVDSPKPIEDQSAP